ncbi:uncharacterized protein FFMR_10762 [Fusarium fujikuroi]
MPRIY